MKITTMLPGGGKRCETDIRIKITVGDFLRGNFTGRDFNFFPRLSGDLQEEEQKIRQRCSMTQLQNNTIKKKENHKKQMKASAPLSQIMLLCRTEQRK